MEQTEYRKDVRNQCDNELVNIFANDPSHYADVLMAPDFETLKEIVDTYYIYNEQQLTELKELYNSEHEYE